MIPEEELDSVLAELLRLDEASIDTSSIVYLYKAGMLGTVSAEIRLSTIEPVLAETGFSDMPVRVVSYETDASSTDDALLAYTTARQLPLVSEDKKLLLKAERHGIKYYNSIMMLCLVAARGRMSETDQKRRFEMLADVAHYHPGVLRFGRELLTYIRKSL